MKKKRIICFIGAMSSGGAEHQLKELSHLLALSDYDVQLATFSDTSDHYIINENVKRVRIAPNTKGVFKLLSIFKFFLTCKTDCIISYGQRANVYCLLPLFFRKRIKVLACERSCTLNRKPDRYERLLVGGLYKRADWIICNSYSQAKHIVNVRPEWEYKVKTIINYIDLGKYTYKPLPHNNPPRIGVFARYIKLKNYERLIEAALRLKKEGYLFTIEWYGNKKGKGGIDNKEYLELKELVSNRQVEDVFLLHDNVPCTADVIPNYDAVCLASLWEGFSNTIAEAISCGRPLLASNVSDNVVMVKNNVNGLLFDPLVLDQIYHSFVSYLNLSESQREAMGANSRKIAESLFNEEVFLQSYIKYIES